MRTTLDEHCAGFEGVNGRLFYGYPDYRVYEENIIYCMDSKGHSVLDLGQSAITG